MISRRTKGAIALLTALAICALTAGCKTEDQIQEQQLVTLTQEAANYYDTRSVLNVTGEGLVTLEPDTAVVGFTVVGVHEDAAEGQQLANELMDAVLGVIRSKGIPEADIETGRLRFNEIYDYDKSPAELVEYNVYYSVTVTVHDMDVLGAMISEAVAAGASSVSGPTYSIDDDTEAYIEALGMAVEAAKAKAEAMASSAGVRLSALPLSIDEVNGENHAVMNAAADMAAAAPAEEAVESSGPDALEISVPEIEVRARVQAAYQITR